jgi:hypothetical protein
LFRGISLFVSVGRRVEEAVRMTALRTSPIRGAYTNKRSAATQVYTLSFETFPCTKYNSYRDRRKEAQRMLGKTTVSFEPLLRYVDVIARLP